MFEVLKRFVSPVKKTIPLSRLMVQLGGRQELPFVPDKEQGWLFVAGDYSRFKGIVVERPNWGKSYEGMPIEQLRGCELFFRDIVEYYLERNNKTGKPTVAWDVGAMAATTWVRLGCAFRDQVEAGKLALVASSRTYSPANRGFRAFTSREGTAFLQENSHLVNYLAATASTFKDLAITLPNGKTINLLGQVHFVHEADSLSRYSLDPEYEIGLLAQIVAEDGVYFSYGGFPYQDHLQPSDYGNNEHLKKVLRAHHTLTANYGFTLITCVEAGLKKGQDLRYAILKRPGSPQIFVD